MKVISLSENTIINERLCLKGEIVQVDDYFDVNIEKVIATPEEIHGRKQEERIRLRNAKTKLDLKDLGK